MLILRRSIVADRRLAAWSLIATRGKGAEMEYEKPMIGGGVANGYDPAIKKDGTILDSGYIALQAESQPVEFRNVRLLNLSGCMDPSSPAYRSYFVHRDDSTCR